jgi:hypothetical protein
MDVRDAMLEMSRWSDDQRVTVYHQMDVQGHHEQAARILRQLPPEQRKTVVLKAQTKSIARIIQVFKGWMVSLSNSIIWPQIVVLTSMSNAPQLCFDFSFS